MNKVFFLSLTNYMEQCPSQEDKSCLDNQEIPHLVRNTKGHYCGCGHGQPHPQICNEKWSQLLNKLARCLSGWFLHIVFRSSIEATEH